MRKLLFISLFIIAALSCAAKPKVSTLPPWFAAALADPDTYIGVSPPSDNKEAAEDMAIATAVLNWTFNSKNCLARVVGELTEHHGSQEEMTYTLQYYFESAEKPSVLISSTYFNDNGECFVACKIRPSNAGEKVVFEKNTSLNLACDTLYDTSSFNMNVEVDNISERSHRTKKRDIFGSFSRRSSPNKSEVELSVNGVSMQTSGAFSYPSIGYGSIKTGAFPIDIDFGTSLYRLVTAIPPSIFQLKGRSVQDEDENNDGSKGTAFYVAFEGLTDRSRPVLSLTGIDNDRITFDLKQEELVKDFTDSYPEMDPENRMYIARSAYAKNLNLGQDAGYVVALIDATTSFMESYKQLKGRVVENKDVDDDFAKFYAAYERLSQLDGLALIWHIGDGQTNLPDGVVGYDFDYSCGVSFVQTKDFKGQKKKRQEALAQAIAESQKTAPDYEELVSTFINDKQSSSSGVRKQTSINHKNQASNCFAVIIANENYDEAPSIPTAGNDGEEFRRYLTDILGVPADNVYFYKDATYGKMMQALEKIKKASNVFNDIDVIFYYAGHGIPDVSSKAPYLLPVDADPGSTAVCLSVDSVYSTLGRLPLRSATVFLDACFSGTQRDSDNMLVAARGVRLKPKAAQPKSNLVVFSACSGDQTAYSLSDKKHGAFTYHLLEKLKETGGRVSLGELSDYLNEAVPRSVFKSLDKVQTPTVSSSRDIADTWRSRMLLPTN